MPRESGEADGTKARSKLNVFLSFCILHGYQAVADAVKYMYAKTPLC